MIMVAQMTQEEQTEFFRDRALTWHDQHVPPLFAAASATAPGVIAWADAYPAGGDGPKHSLLLLGPTGVGKTYEAYGALRRIAEAGPRYAAWRGGSVPQLLAQLRPGGSDDPDQVYARIANASILLVDDIGAEKSTPWTEEIGLRLIDHRYINRLPVIVTGNGSWREISTAIGDRIASRLVEMCQLIEFKGADRRWKR
jgi:DNA replication protein DnaC